MKQIDFNKPYFSGKETEYIRQAVESMKISGNGIFTQKCQNFFEVKYGFKKSLLTSSCTDALEMSAILLNIKEGDEVIMPSFTFVSTANAFILRGAKIIFADSHKSHPNMDETKIEELISERTKAIVAVHYAGFACNMKKILEIANKNNLYVVEDAAQSIDSFYEGKPLGSLGHLAAFSFHETKNIISGEGGMLAVNNDRFINRAEIIWEKGTNRAAFWRGEVKKYDWVDIGSSFLPSEIISAFLYAQLEQIDQIQAKRKKIWNQYFSGLSDLSEFFLLPQLPSYASNNAHMFYIVCKNKNDRTSLIAYLRQKGIWAVSHYLSLHKSPFYAVRHDGRVLSNADYFTNCLLRLPLYYELQTDQVEYIIESIHNYFRK